jgi:hypothetical protein
MKKFRNALLLLMSFALIISACKKDEESEDPVINTGDYKISGYSQDAVSFTGITGAVVSLLDNEGNQVSSVNTDASGNYQIDGIGAGQYSLVVTKDGYHNQTASMVQVGEITTLTDVFVGFMPADLSITVPVGAFCGTVLDANGNVMANATVAISAEDESLTNGYFTTTTSDASGKFAIGAIPLEAAKGDLIPAFKIKIIQGMYIIVIHNVVIAANNLIVKNVNLVDQNVPGNTIFADGFETGTGWTYEGFWHQQASASIVNSNYTAEYVKLAPNDLTNGAIPGPYAGMYSAWYGQETTGSFIGEAQTGQEIWSGGTSVESNHGAMISPEITLAGLNQASLSFWSWFEIESVNPNEFGYDIMEIFVIDVNTGVETSIGRLNPFSDPILEDRDALPFTSGGFNKAPVWNNVAFDLSNYAGAIIQLKFDFRTIDGLYNGFRGWFVDEVLVTDKAPLKAANTNKVYGPDPKPRH